jgi:hypothetical protein
VGVRVVRVDGGHRLVGEGPVTEAANRWFAHLESRNFAAATVRGYAVDVLNFGRFLAERAVPLSGTGRARPIMLVSAFRASAGRAPSKRSFPRRPESRSR